MVILISESRGTKCNYCGRSIAPGTHLGGTAMMAAHRKCHQKAIDSGRAKAKKARAENTTLVPSFKVRRLTGRCANGYGRDAGSRSHAVPDGSLVAVCGATYGKRSAGWSEDEEYIVTCPKCLKKLSRGGLT